MHIWNSTLLKICTYILIFMLFAYGSLGLIFLLRRSQMLFLIIWYHIFYDLTI